MTPDSDNHIFRLADEFVNQTSQHVFLTGKAGTGKTTFLRHVRQTTHKNCIVAAPTGVAAVNAGGVTLHSLFQLPFEPFVPGSEFGGGKERFRMSGLKLDMLRRLELLIIDEVSMLRADTLDSIDAVLRRTRRSDRPFGGVQMVYIGDLFQLPPVVKDEEWSILREYYLSPFFFHAKSVQSVPPVYLELKKVYRQREHFFVELLNRVRNDELTPVDLEMLNRQYQPDFEAPDGEKYITLATRNAKADFINDRELRRLITPTHRFTGEIQGEFPEYSLPTEMTLLLKEGAQIMFIKNDLGEAKRYYNGKIGTVSRIRDGVIEVKPEGSDEPIAVERETWENIRYTLNKDSGEIEEEKLGAFIQYPIRLAWAITIHKSQGLTFERAIIDTGDAFAPGQAYVALSRCTSLAGIVLLSRITPSSVRTDVQAVNLAKSEKEETELHRILEDGKRRFWAERLLQYFDCTELVNISRNMFKILDDKVSNDFDPARLLAKRMLRHAYEIQEVADKFRGQLKSIMQTEDMALLTERCRKAVIYFHRAIIDQMLLPLQQYIVGFTIKKAKTFHKNICNLELDLKLFIESMKKVRYNDVPLAADLDLPVPERGMLYPTETKTAKSTMSKTITEESTKTNAVQSTETELNQAESTDKPRISSNRQSFDLFKEGLSVVEIAQARKIGETTVLGHLAEFVQTGDLSAFDLLPRNAVDNLMPWVQAAVAEDNLRLAPIKESVDPKYSYSDIRIVMNHCLYERTR